MPARHLAMGLLVMAIWGSQVVPMKLALAELPPLVVQACRWVVLLALLPLVRRPRGPEWRTVAMLGLLAGTIHFAAVFLALTLIPAAIGGVVYQVNTPFALLLGWLILKERPGVASLAGVAVAMAGVGVIAGEPDGSADPLGVALTMLGALCLALANVLSRRMPRVAARTAAVWQAPIALAPTLLLSALFESGQGAALAGTSLIGWASVLWAALVGGFLAWNMWLFLLARHPISRLAPLMLLTAPFAVGAGILVLGESLSWQQAGGCALAVAGVALSQLGGTQPGGSPDRRRAS